MRDLTGRLLATPRGRVLSGVVFAIFWVLATVTTTMILRGTLVTNVVSGFGGALISMTIFLWALSRQRLP